MRVSLIIAAVLALVFLIFTLQNTQLSKVQFLGWDWYIPTIVLLLVAFILGLVIGWILEAVFRGRKGRAAKRTKEAVQAGK